MDNRVPPSTGAYRTPKERGRIHVESPCVISLPLLNFFHMRTTEAFVSYGLVLARARARLRPFSAINAALLYALLALVELAVEEPWEGTFLVIDFF